MVTVVCVYRPGGGFTDEYVHRLKCAVSEYSTVHDRFVCLTTRKIRGVETIGFKQNWMGWWSKLELFRPGLFTGRVFYMDLDTMLVGDISELVSDTSDFISLTNWEGNGTHVASAVMGWNADLDFSRIYAEFHPRVIPEYEKGWEKWGDQAWIQERLPVPFESYNLKYPDRIVSYKHHIRWLGAVPSGASIVCFHGRPRPHAVGWTLPERAM